MDVSNAKLKRISSGYFQEYTLESGLRDILSHFDPTSLPSIDEEEEAMLDRLVQRHGRILA
jgi:hypothetical protein